MSTEQIVTIVVSGLGMAVFFVLAIVAWSRATGRGEIDETQSAKADAATSEHAQVNLEQELPAPLTDSEPVAVEHQPIVEQIIPATEFLPMMGEDVLVADQRPAPRGLELGPNDGNTEFIARDEILDEAVQTLDEVSRASAPVHVVESDGFAEHLAAAAAALARFEAALEQGIVDLNALEDGPLRDWQRELAFLCAAEPRHAAALQVYLDDSVGERAEQLAAILVALHRDGGAVRRSLLHAANRPRPAQLHTAIHRAVVLWDDPEADALARAMYDATSDDARAAEWLMTINARGMSVEGAALERALVSSDSSLLTAGLRALTRETGEAWRSLVERNMIAKQPERCMAALEVGVMIDSRSTWMTCRQRARKPGYAQACELMAALGGLRERETLRVWARSSEVREAALVSLGSSGRREDIEVCVAALDDEDMRVVRAARIGLARTTGYVVEDAMSGGGRDAKAWWASHGPRFRGDTRYVAGRAFDISAVAAVLRSGEVEHRRALAREVWVRSGGAVRVRCDGFVEGQRRSIAILPEITL